MTNRIFPRNWTGISFAEIEIAIQILFTRYLECQDKVHQALCDSIDTKSALAAIRTVVNQCNVYTQERRAAKEQPNPLLLEAIAKYLTKMFKVRGVKMDYIRWFSLLNVVKRA